MKEIDKKIVAERLINLRNKKNLSQRITGIKANISNATISKIEAGASIPDGYSLFALAEFFNVSTDYLLGRTDNPKMNNEEYEPLSDIFENIIPKLKLLPDEDLYLVNGYIDKILEKNKQLELQIANIFKTEDNT